MYRNNRKNRERGKPMNVYQKKIISKTIEIKLKSISNEKDGRASFSETEVTFVQNEDYSILNYLFCLKNESIIKIGFLYDDWTYDSSTNGEFKIEMCFNNKATAIRFYFIDDIVEVLELPILYIELDKKTYDEKIQKENRNDLHKKLNLRIKSSEYLVNIFWNTIDIRVKKTVIKIYMENELISCFESQNNKNYVLIDDLLYGEYEFTVNQYDSDNKVIFESDRQIICTNKNPINVIVEKMPLVSCDGGRHTIRI